MEVIQHRLFRVQSGIKSLVTLRYRDFNEELKQFFFGLERVSKTLPIPAGRYRLQLKKEETPLTLKYRTRFPEWFSWHIEIVGVPGFTDVYFHIGNRPEDSDACVLIGTTADVSFAFTCNSAGAYRRFYELITPRLEAGEEIWLTITD